VGCSYGECIYQLHNIIHRRYQCLQYNTPVAVLDNLKATLHVAVSNLQCYKALYSHPGGDWIDMELS